MSKKKKNKLKKKQLIQETLSPKSQSKKAALISSIPFSFKTEWIPIVIISIFAFVLYLKTIPYEYILDDKIVITDNQYTKAGVNGVWNILSTDSFQGYFGEKKDLVMGARYRPLSLVTFAIEHQFFGLNPKISHFINILLYIFCCILIYRMLLFIIPKKNAKWFSYAGLFITMIYLLHPVHVEAVANIKGRDEIMAMMGSIGALIFAFKYQEKSSILNLVLMVLCFLLGLFSKETTLTFLAVIPLSQFFRSKKIDQKVMISTLALFVASAIYLWIRYSIIGYLYDSQTNVNDLMNNPFVEMNVSERLATIIYTTGVYIKLSFFPHPLTHDYYPYHIPIMNFGDPKVIVTMIGLFGLAIFSFVGMIKKSWMAYGIIFFFLTLSIVSNAFVNVGTFMNERFLFMPSLGLCIFLVLGINWLNSKVKKGNILAYGLIGIFALGFFVKSWTRIPVWKDTYALNSAAIKVSKNSARLNSFMSTAIYNKVKEMDNRGEKLTLLNEGIGYARKAIEIYPSYNNGHLMLAGISAEIYGIDNKLDKFLVDLKRAASSRPDIPFITEYCEYLNGRSNVDTEQLLDFYYNLGYSVLYKTRKNSRWALHYLRLGHSLDQRNSKINLALAEIYTFIGDRQNAEKFKNYGTE